MVRGKDRWIWIIPITAKKTSIGVVLDGQAFKRMKLEPEEAYHQILQENPQVTEQLSQASSPKSTQQGISLFGTNTLRVSVGSWQGMPLGLLIRFGAAVFS
jgi:hypothetical protein